MSISQQEYQRRYSAIRELMKANNMDCLVVVGKGDDFNRGNVRYVTGSGSGGCVIFPLEGQPVFFVNTMQSASPKIRKIIDAFDLLDIKDSQDITRQTGEEVKRFDRGNNLGVVGRECMSVSMYLLLKELYGERLTVADSIFENVRAVKSNEEIEKMRVAASVADDVFEKLLATLQPSLSDYTVYALVESTIYEHGCDYSFDLIDGEGGKMNMTFWPTGEVLKSDSTLFMEITPAFEGYYAQLPVTLPVGRYPELIRKMKATWKKADTAVQPLLKPGTPVSDIYRCLIQNVEDGGFVSPLRPGHAIGLDVLDFWSITESSPVILQEGMTVAVHPSVMTKLGGDACGMGYTYLITADGSERFSRVDLDSVGN